MGSTRFIGLEDAGRRPFGYRQRPGVLVVHVVTVREDLPKHAFQFLGQFNITRAEIVAQVHSRPEAVLSYVSQHFGREFSAVVVAP